MAAMNIGQQVIERKDGTRFIKSAYRDGSKLYTLIGGKRQSLVDNGKVVDVRGKKVYEFSR